MGTVRLVRTPASSAHPPRRVQRTRVSALPLTPATCCRKQIFDDEGERQSDRYLVLSAEPGGRSIQPTVYYVELESYKWMGSLLQFEGILGYDCEASDNELDSAFAPWSPGFADLAPEDKVCLLGQHTVYERRKPCRVCKVGEGYGIVKKDTRACDCGKMDYAWYVLCCAYFPAAAGPTSIICACPAIFLP